HRDATHLGVRVHDETKDLLERPAPIIVVKRNAKERVAKGIRVVTASKRSRRFFARYGYELFVLHDHSPLPSTESRDRTRRTPNVLFAFPVSARGAPGQVRGHWVRAPRSVFRLVANRVPNPKTDGVAICSRPFRRIDARR